MESELRWILIIVSLAILGLIIFDGWRRIKRQKISHPKKQKVMDFESEELEKSPYVSEEEDEEESPLLNNKKEIKKPITIGHAVFVLNILPEQGRAFAGSHLLPTLLTLGMRYGDMSIFHRHEQSSGHGNILFSLASATEPGTFDLDKMESQVFYGLTLFFQIPGPSHPTNALNLMIQTAKRLTHVLGAKLCDERRQPLDEATLEKKYHVRLGQMLLNN